HHAGGGGHHVAADLGAFLEGPAGAFTIVSDALGVHVGATHIAGHRIRDLLLDDLLLHAADRVRHALDLGLFHHPADGVGHLLDDGVGHLLANGVGDLLVDTLLHVGGAGDLLAHVAFLAHPAAADLVRLLAADLDPARLAAGLAGAGVEAAIVTDL